MSRADMEQELMGLPVSSTVSLGQMSMNLKALKQSFWERWVGLWFSSCSLLIWTERE